MQIRWTKVPFPARDTQEFSRGLTDWLGRVFYEVLPDRGYEVREEQIFTAFRARPGAPCWTPSGRMFPPA